MYAIIVTGGKQYKVSEGDEIRVEKLDVEAGKDVTFDNVNKPLLEPDAQSKTIV